MKQKIKKLLFQLKDKKNLKKGISVVVIMIASCIIAQSLVYMIINFIAFGLAPDKVFVTSNINYALTICISVWVIIICSNCLKKEEI